MPDHAAKQISHETTFGEDVTDLETLRAWVSELAGERRPRGSRHRRTAKTVVLKVRYGDFTTITRSRTLGEATDATAAFFGAADEMLRTGLPKRRLSVRLIGVGVTGLSGSGGQKLLFGGEPDGRRAGIDAVADAIANRFGRCAGTGPSVGLKPRERMTPPKP